MSEDPPLVGLGVNGATYSLPAQSHVSSMAIGNSRVASGGGMPFAPWHSPLALSRTSPHVDAPTPGMWGAGSETVNTSNHRREGAVEAVENESSPSMFSPEGVDPHSWMCSTADIGETIDPAEEA